jgi:hypothetical protein
VSGFGVGGGSRRAVPVHRRTGNEIAAGNSDAEIARAVSRAGYVQRGESGLGVCCRSCGTTKRPRTR